VCRSRVYGYTMPEKTRSVEEASKAFKDGVLQYFMIGSKWRHGHMPWTWKATTARIPKTEVE
jgi:hypothetical protein